MKTAISLPDGDYDRFERVAHRHGMNRSQFYRTAAARFADELEGASELTARANAALAEAARAPQQGHAFGDAEFLGESERLITENLEW